ncbi:hypothetical protein BDN72DRAFT_893037 [Pluteus cervinus]|uniref:Uncharacterized protein n=1 Tax=Pluteus cervinus TaxID=181527 RepID=A0ACD3BA30_9AGAR|nr:hypothetical protein BDN72DRAFT_893037 [Pluteus cervinus]
MPSRNPLIASIFFIISVCCGLVNATDSSDSFETDPYLKYRPPFARSLPVQILLTGVVLTLVAVLFIHLIFTAQYHWPLAPVNYVLQLSGVTTLLISLIATLHVVLSATFAESEKWPYMLSYIAVNVPPLDIDDDSDDWTVAERATWLVMNASTSGLIQITHIQFLTLLYPSRLEGRLIFALLGPLAIVAAVMQLLPIHGSLDVNTVASAVRNVCNATLSLLFTTALFIWGLLVNRKQAWRTDGGTAAFGCAALSLAIVSTALNFLYVPREEEYVWLPGLMWAVVLWQSFLGWWWWVGAGSNSGVNSDDPVEEKLRKEAKRESRRKEAKAKRSETKKRAKRVWKGVAGAFGRDGHDSDDAQIIQRRSHSLNHSDHDDNENHRRPTLPSSPHPPLPASRAQPTSTSTYSVTSAGTFNTLPRALPAVVHRWYANLRRAHLVAARQQAAERVERIRELERNASSDRVRSGWGLGSFGWRLPRDDYTRRSSPHHSRNPTSLSPRRSLESLSSGADDAYDQPERRRRRRRKESPEIRRHSARSISFDRYAADLEASRGRRSRDDVEELRHSSSNLHLPATSITSRPRSPRHSPPPRTPPAPQTEPANTRSRSMWWWGPLWRWRLQDSTVY